MNNLNIRVIKSTSIQLAKSTELQYRFNHSHPIVQLSLVGTEKRQKDKLESALADSDSDTKIIPPQDLDS